MSRQTLPVLIIGAGPVGLAAAVHLQARGLTPLLLESGAEVGTNVRRWGHVRMFSPWLFNIDPLAARLLSEQGWIAPDPNHFPTGAELVDRYLLPLATHPELASQLRLSARVTAISRQGLDRMKNDGREQAPFVVRYEQHGVEQEILVQAVMDASGSFASPNPLGAAGLPALGERAAAASIEYGLPEVYGAQRERYAGKRVLVVGSGHSAFNVLTDLVRLAADVPDTRIHWAVRQASLRRVFGGGENDQLKERGKLGLRIARLVQEGRITVHAGTRIERIERTDDGWRVHGASGVLPAVDELIGCTGFRPDYSLLDELRLDLDPGTQAPSALAPLIDPNLHSCGTVRPHGAMELKHPDSGLYVVGMKSYGRAPTFLLLTGYEQVRSVAAAIAGDWEAARRVELQLPETGVCSLHIDESEETAAGCCGGPAPVAVDACCVADAEAKSSGASGCGCDSKPPETVLVAAPVRRASACCGTGK